VNPPLIGFSLDTNESDCLERSPSPAINQLLDSKEVLATFLGSEYVMSD